MLPIATSPRTIFFLGKRGQSLLHTLHTTRLMFPAHDHSAIAPTQTLTVHSLTRGRCCEFDSQHIRSGKMSSRKLHQVPDQSAGAWLAVSCRSKWAIFPLRLDIIGSGGACAEGLAWAKLGWMGWETSMQHKFRSEHPLRYFRDFPIAVNIVG